MAQYIWAGGSRLTFAHIEPVEASKIIVAPKRADKSFVLIAVKTASPRRLWNERPMSNQITVGHFSLQHVNGNAHLKRYNDGSSTGSDVPSQVKIPCQ
jgi:hypothetical protein